MVRMVSRSAAPRGRRCSPGIRRREHPAQHLHHRRQQDHAPSQHPGSRTTIAPFLQLDHDPYVVISDERLYWMQDAYTPRATGSPTPSRNPTPGPTTSATRSRPNFPARYASDSRNAPENCGLLRSLSICGAKNHCPSRGHLALTGSTLMCWRRCFEECSSHSWSSK